MNLTKGIIRNAAQKVLGTAKITYDVQDVDLEVTLNVSTW